PQRADGVADDHRVGGRSGVARRHAGRAAPRRVDAVAARLRAARGPPARAGAAYTDRREDRAQRPLLLRLREEVQEVPLASRRALTIYVNSQYVPAESVS